MYVIFTLADLRCLRDANTVPASLLDEIEANIRDLHSTLGDIEPVEQFTLGTSEPFAVILQPGDGPGIYQLLPDGIPQNRPEWIGQNNYGGTVIYQVIYLRGNDRALNLFVPFDVLGTGATTPLSEQLSDESTV
ncbi:MAG: hypothetical protein WCJ56_00270 [bacterium]